MKKILLTGLSAIALLAAPVSAQVVLNGVDISASATNNIQPVLNDLDISASGNAASRVVLNGITGSTVLNLNTAVRSTGGSASITGGISDGVSSLTPSLTGSSRARISAIQNNPALNIDDQFSSSAVMSGLPSTAAINGLNFQADTISGGLISARAFGSTADASIRDVTISGRNINDLTFRATAIGDGTGPVSARIDNLRIIGTESVSGVSINTTAIGNSVTNNFSLGN